MPRLLPCPRCDRHVRASETSCPFCRTTIAPLAVALAIAMVGSGAMVGCGQAEPEKTESKTATERKTATASVSTVSPQESAAREALERERERLEKEAASARDVRVLYGSPQMSAPQPSTSASAVRPKGPCNCAKGDPLCDCR